MTASIVGKVVNMTLSRTSAMPHWSTWLSDWVRDDDTKVQVTTETFPADLGAEEEIEEDHAIEAINQAIQQ